MEILDADDFIQLLVESGVPLIQGRVPVTIYDKPTKKANKPMLPYDHPINQNKRSEITEAALCKAVGIKENELLRYLVEHGALF